MAEVIQTSEKTKSLKLMQNMILMRRLENERHVGEKDDNLLKNERSCAKTMKLAQIRVQDKAPKEHRTKVLISIGREIILLQSRALQRWDYWYACVA